jgi:hypothetical protein
MQCKRACLLYPQKRHGHLEFLSAKGQKRTDTVGANQSCRIALNQNDGHPKGYVLLEQAFPSCSEPVTGGSIPPANRARGRFATAFIAKGGGVHGYP